MMTVQEDSNGREKL